MTDAQVRRTLGVVLFPGFELLDVFGPLEAFGMLSETFAITMIAETAGPVASAQGPKALAEFGFADAPTLDIILVPGGIGTRTEIENRVLLDWLADRGKAAEITSSVCTGAALLAGAGLLDGRRATTNKMFFSWVADQRAQVTWVPQARWVEDGSFFTSSGVSAGIDMALTIIAQITGTEIAANVARAMEYEWHRDATWDPFAKIWGLV